MQLETYSISDMLDRNKIRKKALTLRIHRLNAKFQNNEKLLQRKIKLSIFRKKKFRKQLEELREHHTEAVKILQFRLDLLKL